MPHSFRRSSLLAVLVLLAVFVPFAQPAHAANIIVTSFADSGTGTLRAAITTANAAGSGGSTITFSSAGTITLSSPLPALTAGSIRIDGTQGGGTIPQVEIKGSGSVKGAGILIHSSNNIIRGLIFNGFIGESFGVSPDYGGAGVIISGSATAGVAANNTIEYNYIGTNASGNAIGYTRPSNNERAGILMLAGASNNIIQNNVISGNNGPGIYFTITRDTSDLAYSKLNNTIRNNIIGLNASGDASIPNAHGIWVGLNSDSTVIGPGNTISGNGNQGTPGNTPFFYGVYVQYDYSITLSGGSFYPRGTVVKGNKIGTSLNGTVAVPNKDGGVYVGVSTNTTIGGSDVNSASERNVISGHYNFNSSGVILNDYQLDSTHRTIGAVVKNNWIGLDATGAAALPNRISGVLLAENVSGATIGPNNVISGNGSTATGVPAAEGFGVQITATATEVTNNHQASGNTISGNRIGTNANGTAGFTNQSYGISLKGDTSNNTIANNIIAYNPNIGIRLESDGVYAPHNNTIRSNQIGINGSGSTVGNGPVGIEVRGPSNIIGPSNVIAGHATTGIAIFTAQNTVKGNTIRNNGIGVQISAAATGNVIGGSTIADGNSVTNNTSDGIVIAGSGTTGNKISHTTTNANGSKGIWLSNGGNAPITSASLSVTVPPSGFLLSGSATGCAGGCTIEVFTDDNLLDNEGPTFLPTTPAMTNINGAFSNIDITGCKHYLIFTLTDTNGNTSEFINPTSYITQCVPVTPIVVLSTATPASPQSALPGASRRFQHTVSNNGSAPGVLTFTTASSNGWTSALDTGDCPTSPATLGIGASCIITLTVTVPVDAAVGSFNDTTLTAALSGASATASRVDRTTALLSAGLTLTPATQAKTTGPGQPVSYVHTLTNTGNGADSFAISVVLDANMTGWTYSISPAGPISLAQNDTAQVTVTYTPTAGIASPPTYMGTVRATSTTDTNVFKEATDTTTITSAAVPQISSVFTPANGAGDPGSSIDATYTITNVGNISGTFDLVFTGPAGWVVMPASLASIPLDVGSSQTVMVTLQIPASAIAGNYAIALTATATAAPNAQATKLDYVTVNKVAGVLLTSTFTDAILRSPNSIITYTEQLTNTGNFTDSITLAATTTATGWTVRPIPTNITLFPGTTTPVDVEVHIPLGVTANSQSVTHVTATSSLPAVTSSADITTTIAAVADASLQPNTQQKIGDAGHPITFTYTLINSGSIPQSYTLAAAGLPGDWNSTLTSSVPSLAPGASQIITLTVTAPTGTPDGTQAVATITASCEVATPCASAQPATAQVTIGPPFSVGLDGTCNTSVLPGEIATCVHTITNTGFVADTYLVSAISPLGWTSSIVPALVTLQPGKTGVVTVTLSVPTTIHADTVHDLTVRVRSTALFSITQTKVDQITVLQFAGVSFATGYSMPPTSGQSIEFQHTVQNIGNGLDSYTITAVQDLDWDITIVPTKTIVLDASIKFPVTVIVQVPSNSTLATFNHITVRAVSAFDPTVSEELVDIVGVAGLANQQVIYVPVLSK